MSEPVPGDHPAGERGGVELVLGVEDERSVHGAHPLGPRRPAVQQVEEMPADDSSSVSTSMRRSFRL